MNLNSPYVSKILLVIDNHFENLKRFLIHFSLFCALDEELWWIKFYFIFKNDFLNLCMCAGTFRCKKRGSNSLELQLEVVLTCPMSVLVTELRSSVRAVSILDQATLVGYMCLFRFCKGLWRSPYHLSRYFPLLVRSSLCFYPRVTCKASLFYSPRFSL